MKIAELKVTSSACPAQLEGTTDTGLFIYARARSDRVFVGLGKTFDEAVTGESNLYIQGRFNITQDGYATSDVEKLINLTKAFIAMVE